MSDQLSDDDIEQQATDIVRGACRSRRCHLHRVIRRMNAQIDLQGRELLMQFDETIDEIGFHAAEHRHYVTNIHATVLTQLGLNPHSLEVPGHKRLEIEFGKAIRQIIA